METGRYLVLHGIGVGFFTRTYIADDLAAGALREVVVRGLKPIVRGSALVRRRRSMPLSPAAAELIQALRSQAEELVGSAKDGLAARSRGTSRRRLSHARI